MSIIAVVAPISATTTWRISFTIPSTANDAAAGSGHCLWEIWGSMWHVMVVWIAHGVWWISTEKKIEREDEHVSQTVRLGSVLSLGIPPFISASIAIPMISVSSPIPMWATIVVTVETISLVIAKSSYFENWTYNSLESQKIFFLWMPLLPVALIPSVGIGSINRSIPPISPVVARHSLRCIWQLWWNGHWLISRVSSDSRMIHICRAPSAAIIFATIPTVPIEVRCNHLFQ